jgi:hypothetical protein
MMMAKRKKVNSNKNKNKLFSCPVAKKIFSAAVAVEYGELIKEI